MTSLSPPKVLLTRPVDAHLQALQEQHNPAWLAQLRNEGINADWLPLLAIEPISHPRQITAITEARNALAHFDALMFVSASAALHFWDAAAIAHWHELFNQCSSAVKAPRLWTPGTGSAQLLLQLGFPDSAIDRPPAHVAQMESETLWPVIAPQVERKTDPTPFHALIVRGTDTHDPLETAHLIGHGRPWLAQQIEKHKGRVNFVVAYERSQPHWSAEDFTRAQNTQTDGSIWIFSSSQSIAQLALLLPHANWSQARAVATHPRIATKARQLGFREVLESQPNPQSLAHSLKSMVS